MNPPAELRLASQRMRQSIQAGDVVFPPAVALAVADWLDRFADDLYCYGPAEYDSALKIARAYLGTKGEEQP